MRNKFFCFIGMLVISTQFVLPQSNTISDERYYNGVAVGLGVTGLNIPEIVDYINYNFSPTTKLDDFAAAAEFFGSGAFQISSQWGIKLEYAYLIKTYTIPVQSFPDNNFTSKIHMPTVIVQYIIPGNGFLIKFGAGAGYHIAQFSQDLFYSSSKYQAYGVGLKLEAEGNTAFDDHLFGYIAMDIRGNFMSDFKDSGNNSLLNRANGKIVGMDFFTVGIKFGLVYYY